MVEKKKVMIEINGKEYSTNQIFKEFNVPKATYYRKIKEGYSREEAVKWCIDHPKKTYTFEGQPCTVDNVSKTLKISTVSIYKYLNQGYSLDESVSIIQKNRTEAYSPILGIKQEIKKYFYHGQDLKVSEIAKLENISSSNLHRRLKDGESIEEAIKAIKQTQAIRQVTEIVLDRKTKYILENGMPLYRYCIEHGYNYQALVRRILTHNYTPDKALNEYLSEGQLFKGFFKYKHGEVLLSHLLLKYELNANYVISLMKENDWTLEEAIPKAVFSRQNEQTNKWESEELYELYQLFTMCDVKEKELLVNELQVTKRQLDIIERNHKKICYLKREFLYYELAPQLKTLSLEEQEKLIKLHSITKEELDYINNGLYQDFTLVDKRKNGKVYIKNPVKTIDN